MKKTITAYCLYSGKEPLTEIIYTRNNLNLLAEEILEELENYKEEDDGAEDFSKEEIVEFILSNKHEKLEDLFICTPLKIKKFELCTDWILEGNTWRNLPLERVKDNLAEDF